MPEWRQRVCKKVKELLNKGAEGISSQTGERIADYVVGVGVSAVEFNSDLEHLKRNSTMLNHVAVDIKNEVQSEELKGRKKRKREVSKWLDVEEEIQRNIGALDIEVQGGCFTHLTFVGRVRELNKRVKEHIEQRKHFGELVLDDCERRGEKLLTGKMYGAAFQRNLTKIYDSLVAHNILVIGIQGIPGSGKTVLAKHIHNKVLEETEFRVYWVEVSKDTTVNKLQDNISDAIGLTLLNENSVEKRAARLNDALKQKRDFVLILENLREGIDLETVGYPFHEDGCRLIITTPSLNVCRRNDCERLFEVKMDEDETWDMFKEACGPDVVFASQLEEDVKSEVKKLCGFPQRIIQLAKTLKTVEEPQGSPEWWYELAGVVEFGDEGR